MHVLGDVAFQQMGYEYIEGNHAVTFQLRCLVRKRLSQIVKRASNFSGLRTGGIELLLSVVHLVEIGILDVGRFAEQFDECHLRGQMVKRISRIGKVAARKEWMLG